MHIVKTTVVAKRGAVAERVRSAEMIVLDANILVRAIYWINTPNTSLKESDLACSRSKRSYLGAISATCRRAPSSAVAFSTVIEPQDTSLAFAMPDEVEVTIRQQVCDRFRDRSQERLDRLFAVDTSHTNVPRVVCRKHRMTRSVRQESVERDQRGVLPGLSIPNGRERNLTKVSCRLK